MIFKASFVVALAIFLLGLILKLSSWFRYSVGASARETRPGARAVAAMRGIGRAILGPGIFRLARALVVDVLLLGRLWRESRIRWLAHMLIFYGFTFLLLFHAFEDQVSVKLFKEYASTLNPYLGLRNLWLLMVVAGLLLAVGRRFAGKRPRFADGRQDRFLLVILAVIMASGVLLEAAKMVSHRDYRRMVGEYSATDDEGELRDLESYWVDNFGVVSPTVTGPFEAATLARGREVHDSYCAGCHSRPEWAAAGYGLSMALRPVAATLDRLAFPTILWVVHWLATFVGLAWLPFSKSFHVLTSPLCLLVDAASRGSKGDPLNLATRRMMELDACTHCGICTSRCSVAVVVEELPNRNILPSEKVVSLKGMVGKGEPATRDLSTVQQGLYLCTNCRHCTDACPVGIDLQELWFEVREVLLRRGIPEMLVLSPLSIHRGLNRERISPGEYDQPQSNARRALEDAYVPLEAISVVDDERLSATFRRLLSGSDQGNTCSTCLECRICTASCPVVRQCGNPAETLGLVPHQIMHAAKLGLAEPVFRSGMLWKCLGCYECQESCPQGVRVTDVLYELKNMAGEHLRAGATVSTPGAGS
jgi:heterodisulfide reductase subunit C/nitrate reductase gamma subunit